MSDETDIDKAETVTTAVTSTVTETAPVDPSKVDNFIRLFYQMPSRVMLLMFSLILIIGWEIRPDDVVKDTMILVIGAWLHSIKQDSTTKP